MLVRAGNGVKGRDYRGGKSGAAQSLNSPWDVALDPAGEGVFVAMAGQHQIWRYNITTGVAGERRGSSRAGGVYI